MHRFSCWFRLNSRSLFYTWEKPELQFIEFSSRNLGFRLSDFSRQTLWNSSNRLLFISLFAFRSEFLSLKKMRENKLGLLACVWVLLCGSCYGRFVVEKNSLKVTSPSQLKDVYECAIGNFGVPQYGGTLVGTVVYPQANQKACKSFDDFSVSFKSKPGGLPIFVLADRGGLWSFRFDWC